MSDDTDSVILPHDPIRRPKLYQFVVEKIEGMIQSGEIKPDQELPSERAIMAAYHVGRPAVREALLALQGKGLIITGNGRRARVRQPSVDNVMTTLDGVVSLMIRRTESLKHLFDVRVFVEAAMARHAATAIDEVHLRELRSRLEENRLAIGDRERFMQTDVAFHRVLFQTANNPVFDAVHGALVNWIMERWRQIKRTRQTETVAYLGHLQIYRAISQRDPDAAEKAMRRHLEASWKTWMRHLGDS